MPYDMPAVPTGPKFRVTPGTPSIQITNLTPHVRIRFSGKAAGISIPQGVHVVCLCTPQAKELMRSPGILLYITSGKRLLYKELSEVGERESYIVTHHPPGPPPADANGRLCYGTPPGMPPHYLDMARPLKIHLQLCAREQPAWRWQQYATCACSTQVYTPSCLSLFPHCERN